MSCTHGIFARWIYLVRYGGERGLKVVLNDLSGCTDSTRATFIDPEYAVTEAPHLDRIVGDKKHGSSGFLDFRQGLIALTGEGRVTDCQNLVDHHHVGTDRDGYGESKPHIHPGRIVLYRRVYESLEFSELDDPVIQLRHFVAAYSKERAIQENVFPAAKIRMESRAQLKEAEDLPVALDGSLVGKKGFPSAA